MEKISSGSSGPAGYSPPTGEPAALPEGSTWGSGYYRVSEDAVIDGNVSLSFTGTEESENQIYLLIDSGVTLTVRGNFVSYNSTTGNRLNVIGGGTLQCGNIGGYLGLTVGSGEDSPTVRVSGEIGPQSHIYLNSGVVTSAVGIKSVYQDVNLCGGVCRAPSYGTGGVKIAEGLTYTDGTGKEYAGTLSEQDKIDAAGRFLRPVSEEDDPLYYVMLPDETENGTVEADTIAAYVGDDVTLTVAPAEGYALESLTVDDIDVTDDVSENEYTFAMPDHDVAVSAMFREAEEPRAELQVTLSADPAEGVSVGDEINFYATVKNTGNVTLLYITLMSDLDLGDFAFSRIDSLAPGEVVEETYEYEVMPGDLDRGYLGESLSAWADRAGGRRVEAAASVNVLSEPIDLPEGNEWPAGYYRVSEDTAIEDGVEFAGDIYVEINAGATLTVPGISNTAGGRLYILGDGTLKCERIGFDVGHGSAGLIVGSGEDSPTVDAGSIGFNDSVCINSGIVITGALNGPSLQLCGGVCIVRVIYPDSVQIADGLTYTDDAGNEYTGTLDGDETETLRGKILRPLTDPPLYYVIPDWSVHGALTAEPMAAAAGGSITLTAEPAEGYALESLTVDDTDVTDDVSENEYTFEMPDHDVAVSATFRPMATVTVEVTGAGSVSIGDQTATAGNPITVPAAPGGAVTLTLAPENGSIVRKAEYAYQLNDGVTAMGVHLPVSGTTATLPVPEDLKRYTEIPVTVTFGTAFAGGADEASAVALTDPAVADLAGGWYLVESDITFEHTLTLFADTHLIIAEGATMTVTTAYGDGILSDYTLTVGGAGALSVKATDRYGAGIRVGNYVQTGAAVTAEGNDGIRCYNEFQAETVASHFTFSGGRLLATGTTAGVLAYDTITLGYTGAGDSIQASGYSAHTMAIADGLAFTDGSAQYDDQTDSDTLMSLTNAELRPVTYTVTFDTDGGTGAIDPETVPAGLPCTLPASTALTAPEGKAFKEWSVQIGEAEPVGMQPEETFTVTADTTVTAVFAQAAATTITVGGYDFLQGEDDHTILLETVDDWNRLAAAVAESNTFSGYTVRMTGDIGTESAPVTRPVGQQTETNNASSRQRFAGAFDGDGHTLTVCLNSADDWFVKNKNYCAPFAYVKNAVIENLHVAGSITTTGTFLGGLIGSTGNNDKDGKCTVQNVRVSVSIVNSYVSSGGKYANHGGLIGIAEGDVTIDGCWFDGEITGNDFKHCGGFIGLNKQEATLTNCLFNPSAVSVDDVVGACEFVHDSDSGSHELSETVYFVTHFGAPENAQGHHVVTAVPEGFTGTEVTAADGETYYVLSGSTAWETLQAQLLTEEVIELTKDVVAGTEDTALVIPSDREITISMNGHTIDRGLAEEPARADGYVFIVEEDANLTIIDGIVTGGHNTGNGGGIFCAGDLTMIGVTVTGNYSEANGAGVYLSENALMTIDQCAITDNTGTVEGGHGVGIYAAKDSGVFLTNEPGGSITISGNDVRHYTTDKPENVYLEENVLLFIDSSTAVTEPIGVSMKTPGEFTLGLSEYAGGISLFRSEDSAYALRETDGGEACLVRLFTVTFDKGEGTGSMQQAKVDDGDEYELPDCDFDAPAGKAFKEWSVQIGEAEPVGMQPEETFTVTADTTVTAVWEEPGPAPAFKSKSVLLSGQIGINFFVDLSMLDEAERQATTMTFDIGGEAAGSDTFDGSFTNPNGDGYFGFTCFISSDQMAETVTATLHYGEDQTVKGTTSVEDYVTYMAGHPESYTAKAIALGESIADYGHYMTDFLREYGAGVSASTEIGSCNTFTEEEIEAVREAVADYALSKSDANEILTGATYKLALGSETTIYMYFKAAEGKTITGTDQIVVTKDGSPVSKAKVTIEGGRYRVRIPNINAAELGDRFTVTVTDSKGNTAVINACALSYANTILGSEAYDNDISKNAMAAFYRYYEATMAYLKN